MGCVDGYEGGRGEGIVGRFEQGGRGGARIFGSGLEREPCEARPVEGERAGSERGLRTSFGESRENHDEGDVSEAGWRSRSRQRSERDGGREVPIHKVYSQFYAQVY